MYIYNKCSFLVIMLILCITQIYAQQVRFSRPMIAVEKQQPVYTIVLNAKELPASITRDIIRIDIHERLNDAGNFIIKLNNRNNIKPSLKLKSNKSNPFHRGDKIDILLVRDKNETSRRLTKGRITCINENDNKPDSSFFVIEGVASNSDIKHQAIKESTVYKIDSSNRHLFTIKKKPAEAQVDITWSGRNETIGLPDLRLGRKIQLNGIGATFNGIYFISEVKHTISSAGYHQSFKLSRNGTTQ